jgi:hypothetical protein
MHEKLKKIGASFVRSGALVQRKIPHKAGLN